MKKILAIDDQQDNLTTIKAVLKSNMPDCIVFTALSGKEGIEIAGKEQPDIILLDIIMPGMDGYEICSRLKENELTKHIPVMMITAIKTDSESRVKGLNTGADAFLSKPIDPVELSTQVKVMLRIKEAEDKLREQNIVMEKLVSEKTHELNISREKLLKDQYYLSRAIEMGKIGTWELDIQNNKLKWTDETFKLFGVPLGTEISLDIFIDYVHTDDREYVIKKWNEALNKKTYDIEHRIIVNNKVKWLREKAEIEFDAEDKPIMAIGFAQDITEQKQTEFALIESENKYRTLFENMNEGFALHEIVLDKKGDPVDYKFLDINPAFTRLTGLNPEKVLGHTAKELLPDIENDPVNWIQIYGKVALTGEEIQFENYSDGVGRWFHIHAFSPAINQFAVTFNDITKRKQTEDVLVIQRQKFANILEGTNAGTWDWNVQTGKLELDERWAEIMGYSLKELEPVDINTWIDNVHPDDLPLANGLLDKHFNKETDYYDVEFRQQHKDGRWVWVNARGKVIEWTEDGKPLIMSGTHLDITERKQAEEELKKHHEHLEELVKERTTELEEKNRELDDALKAFVGRELTIKKLQEKISELKGG